MDEAIKSRDELENSNKFDKPIVTKINTECPFYPAEIEHHEYYNQNKEQPYCQFIITPKIKKFKSIFKQYST